MENEYKSGKEIALNIIDDFQKSEDCPVTFFAQSQSMATCLWRVIKAAEKAGVLDDVKRELFK